MKIEIRPKRIGGTIEAVPSKSVSHRAIIAAGLADGHSRIGNVMLSDDIQATCDAMVSFGAGINRKGQILDIISNGELKTPSHPIDCRESGSTLRFLTPFGGLVDEPVVYKGEPGLGKRPMRPYLDIFKNCGMRCESSDGLPLVVEGRLKPGRYRLRGDVSSQFITGLLFTLPQLESDSEIEITTPLESKSYVDLTMEILERFQVEIENEGDRRFKIKGNQVFRKATMDVEGDYSQAAFWIVAGLIGNGMRIHGLNPETRQGDRQIIDICRKMGGDLGFVDDVLVVNPSRTTGTLIDASQIPDLVPILTVLAALSEGRTEIINASRLRIKESDRLAAIATELNKLGAQVIERQDGLLIYGRERLKGGTVESWNDHRIAMSLAVASIRSEENVVIQQSEAIAKSYPQFFEDFGQLGGQLVE